MAAVAVLAVAHYADSDAVRAHLATIEALIEPMMAFADNVSVEVYGSHDGQVREALASFGAKSYQPYAGFVR